MVNIGVYLGLSASQLLTRP